MDLLVWLVGVVVRRYIYFLILLKSTPLVSALFAAASYFLFIFKMFFIYIIYHCRYIRTTAHVQ